MDEIETKMNVWKREYIENRCYRIMEAVGEEPDEPLTKELLLELVQDLKNEIDAWDGKS